MVKFLKWLIQWLFDGAITRKKVLGEEKIQLNVIGLITIIIITFGFVLLAIITILAMLTILGVESAGSMLTNIIF